MDFVVAIKTCLFDKYATFEGRATRSEFWWFYLFNCLVYLIAALIEDPTLLLVLHFLLIIPNIALRCRRLHDINKSGWVMLIILVPILGPIVLLVCYLTKTDEKDNKYGLSLKSD